MIGQTRLAVIDLVSGDPPITDESGDVGVALNGEIYNFLALQDDLRGRGHTLATAGDTEVIAHLAEDLDPVALAQRLDGMFAFAVWDGRRRRLVLGRDRMGKKPLFYWTEGGRLVFGSEIKAVLAHPWVPRDLDAEVIPAYLALGYAPSPRTFFSGIRSLPPGHVLTFDSRGEVLLEQYWAPPVVGLNDVGRLQLTFPEAAAHVRETLTKAVERRLIADVPLGAFLSGGIDSSAVVGIMAQLTSKPPMTFTIGFDDYEGFDERPYARLVAERFATDHTEFVVRPDAVELLERLVWHHDQPFGDSSAIPTYLLAELTRGHVTVALSGDGGDELFAGYERFAAAMALARCQWVPPAVRGAVAGAAHHLPAGSRSGALKRVRRFAVRADLDIPEALTAWAGFVPDEWRRRLVGDRRSVVLDDHLEAWTLSAGAHPLDRILDFNLRTYLLDDLLPKVDRMSMAHALEVRCPFLDQELVRVALRLRPQDRLKGTSGKRVLREALRDVLPSEVLDRRKRGFGVPVDRWLRDDLRDYLDATLSGHDARVRAQLNGAALDALIAEHMTGAADHGQALWPILTLEVFLRKQGW